MNPASLLAHRRPAHLSLLLVVSALCLVPQLSAAKAAKDKARDVADDGTTDAKAAKREEKANAKVDLTKAGDAESRQLDRLRERLGVTDDAEWTLIADRITQVEKLRGNIAARPPTDGSTPANDKVKRNARAGDAAELDALRAAVSDQLPEAEVKARLARVHEAYQQHEAQLLKAQADLRAVLTVRQEAIIVMAGLLPP